MQSGQQWHRHLITPEISLGRFSCSAYRFFGFVGFVVGTIVLLYAARQRNVPYGIALLIILGTLVTSLLHTMATKIVIGEERLVFYHHFISALLTSVVLAKLLNLPVLYLLDITILALGAFLACARLGCLMVGCCHGRGFRFGIQYADRHVAAGFPPQFKGVPLFPIQAVESLWVTTIIIVAHLNFSLEPGIIAGWFIATYCPARFLFEFTRWRPRHSYFHGLSEAQWTSIFLLLIAGTLEYRGLLPYRWWHLAVLGLLLTLAGLVVLRSYSQRDDRFDLASANHLSEIAEAISLSELAASRASKADRDVADIFVGCTSLGVRISATKIPELAGDTYHYAISRRRKVLTEEAASRLAKHILEFTRLPGSVELIKGSRGVFHLLIHSRLHVEANASSSDTP